MVYTVTFNPAVDYVMHTADIKTGTVNRSSSEQIYIGGKGINVSLVLKELDTESCALGFTAGFTGEAIEKGLSSMGVDNDFIRLETGFSRINVKIKSSQETEINGGGPKIDNASLNRLLEKLDRLNKGDVLVLAGSVPSSLPPNIYEKILKRLSDKEILTVVDASGELLLNVLKYKPFLIKPNDSELGALFNTRVSSDTSAQSLALKLKQMGAVNVLVSMAGNGALLVDERGDTYRLAACRGEVKNSVGAGDSMVAGFIAGYLKTKDYAYALKLGTAAGGATAFSEDLAKKEDIQKLLQTLE